jgi:glucose-6-phosphate isomerase
LHLKHSKTLSNSETIKKWFYKRHLNKIAKHFVAVSTNIERLLFGIDPNVFQCGLGRRSFSLWSAVGLTVSLAIGYDNFEELLAGANQII